MSRVMQRRRPPTMNMPVQAPGRGRRSARDRLRRQAGQAGGYQQGRDALSPGSAVQGSSVEMTVIDTSDHVGWAAAATRMGELEMSSAAGMVQSVLRHCQGPPAHRISRLNILDHGNENGLQLGNDWITMQNIDQYAATLGQLRGHFGPGGSVHLQHCRVGQNHPLMRRLAEIWGVPVYAGTGLQNPVYRVNTGDYERCDPGGTCESDVPRP